MGGNFLSMGIILVDQKCLKDCIGEKVDSVSSKVQIWLSEIFPL